MSTVRRVPVYPAQPIAERRESSLFEFFTFRAMVTPWLIKVVYVLGLVGSFIGLLFTIATGTGNLALRVAGLLVAWVVGNLLWRLLCEAVIIVFSIHEALISIDRRLKHGARIE